MAATADPELSVLYVVAKKVSIMSNWVFSPK